MTPKESRRLYKWALKTAEDMYHQGETVMEKAFAAANLSWQDTATRLREALFYLRRAIQHLGMAEAYFLSFAKQDEEVPDVVRRLDDRIADAMGAAAILLMISRRDKN